MIKDDRLSVKGLFRHVRKVPWGEHLIMAMFSLEDIWLDNITHSQRFKTQQFNDLERRHDVICDS